MTAVRSLFAIICLSLAACLAAGCGSRGKSLAELDADQLLELLEAKHTVTTKGTVELELGKFRITHVSNAKEGQILVQFHLYGILPEQHQVKVAAVYPQYEKRVRDAVIGLVQRTDTDHLTDASLVFFKTEMVAAINNVLQAPLLQDVVFSDFSIDPAGTGAAWSTPTVPAKPSGGHGGGHGGGGHGGGHGSGHGH